LNPESYAVERRRRKRRRRKKQRTTQQRQDHGHNSNDSIYWDLVMIRTQRRFGNGYGSVVARSSN
jgi:hypothetical protein